MFNSMTKLFAKKKECFLISIRLLLILLGVSALLPAQEALQTGEAPGELHMLVGRSLVINSPARLARVSVADPNIADAIILNPNQIQINGKIPGAVSLVLWDEGNQSQTFDLFVDLDILGISQRVRDIFPDEPIEVVATKDLITLSGRASSKEVADKILQLVTAAHAKAISMIDIPAPAPAGEVLLQVRFAEVDRAAAQQFGFNFMSFPGSPLKVLGSTSTQQFGPPRFGGFDTSTGGGAAFTFSDLLNVFVFRPDVELGALIRALQQNNLLQILAEPNLLTQTGKEASFLAGGEFPFPVLQGGGASNAVTIAFKEFGVRLNFTPTLMDDGRIHLKVRPEVSALDFANALTISGFTVPALSTRRVETEMDLGDGQSFAIAGLVDDRLTNTVSKIPGFGDIPLIGQLFRSHSTSRSKAELLVIVTPRVVRPSPLEPLPQEPQFPKPFLPPAAAEGSGTDG